MLTGRYPRTTRCRQNGQAMPADERLLPRILKDHGYYCGLAGKLHLASCANGRVETRIDDGYDEFHWSHHPQPDWPENAYTQWLTSKGKTWEELYNGPATRFVKEGVPAEFHQTTWCAEMADEFIRDRANSPQPWLFSLNCFAPHHPFDPPPEYLSRYHPADMPLPKPPPADWSVQPKFQQLDHIHAHNDPAGYPVSQMTNDEARSVVAAYYAMIEHIDHEVGRLLQTLEETGQRENTIVIFMSDHGEMLGDHGLLLKGPHFFDEAVRVPLVISWPGHFATNGHVEQLVELVDLAPTLMEAVGLAPEQPMQGKSFLPLSEKPDCRTPHRDYVFSEYYNSWTHPDAYVTMFRTATEKIVVYHGQTFGEFYDLHNDPGEFINLWQHPDQQARKLRLIHRAFDASVFTMDPAPPRLGAF